MLAASSAEFRWSLSATSAREILEYAKLNINIKYHVLRLHRDGVVGETIAVRSHASSWPWA
jgi:hypothetical protein